MNIEDLIGQVNTEAPAAPQPSQGLGVPAQEEPQSVDLSTDDINDILGSYGITTTDVSVFASNEDSQGETTHQDETNDDTLEEEPQQDIPDNTSEVVSAMLDEPVEEAEHQEPQDDSTIPLNSPTLLLDQTTSRFSGAEWFNEIQKSRIILAGLGGIGSHTSLNLARMHPAALALYDDDIVEPANMSGQLYGWNDIGKHKVDAVSSTLRQFSNSESIYAIRQKFTDQSEAGDIMICGFDNMAARDTFYHSWKNHLKDMTDEQKAKCLFIDGRLSLTVMQVLCITGLDDDRMERYEKRFLFKDSQAEQTVCSMKQTTYLASMIGALIVNLFTNFIANTLNPVIPYSLPFFTEYDAQYMIFKMEE